MAIFNLIKGAGNECPIEIVNDTGTYTYGGNDYKITLSEPTKSGTNWTMSLASYRKSSSATSYSSRGIYYGTGTGPNYACQKVTFKCNKACTIKGSYGTSYSLTEGSTYNFYVDISKSGSTYYVYLRIALTSAPTTNKGIIAYKTGSSTSTYISTPQTITITPT